MNYFKGLSVYPATDSERIGNVGIPCLPLFCDKTVNNDFSVPGNDYFRSFIHDINNCW